MRKSSPIGVGAPAPDFTLSDQRGRKHTLSDYRGRWVVLYFYPKDNTSGCTKEACAIRDDFPRFEKLRAEVLGVSADSVESHKKFSEKYALPFRLLSDEKKDVIKKYGVWQKKKMMGKEYMGIVRSSFLINPQGRIAKVYENVDPTVHSAQLLYDLGGLIGY